MSLQTHNRTWIEVLALAGLIFTASLLLKIPSNEGFNPSDDGVILAQSYRLIQGEIPHRDFISIRPVGSAWLHAIHFVGFLPLELSARWFVLLEYFLFSLFFTLGIRGFFFQNQREQKKQPPLWPLLLLMFAGNQNHYNLYPWTTIDALLWMSIAYYGWMLSETNRLENRFKWVPGLLLVLGSVMAALSRQTFLLPGLILVSIYTIRNIRKKTVARMLPGIIVGVIPILFYLIPLVKDHGIRSFILQMTGRTEIWETGIVKFWSELWRSPFLLIPILYIGTSLCGRWRVDREVIVCANERYLRWLFRLTGVSSLVVLSACFIYPDKLFAWSFQLFWLSGFALLMARIFEFYADSKSWNASLIIWMIAWTSAISLGDNAPVFTIGLLAVVCMVLSFNASSTWDVLLRNQWTRFVLPVFSLILYLGSLGVQRAHNYRDLGYKSLNYDLGTIFPGLKGIKTQEMTFRYMEEIQKIYTYYGEPVGQFAVWPDNAIIYPLLKSPNPFPLDWVQQPEFVGNEQLLITQVREVLSKQRCIILVEKYSVKQFPYQSNVIDYSSTVYPYLKLLADATVAEPDVWEFFKVYLTK